MSEEEVEVDGGEIGDELEGEGEEGDEKEDEELVVVVVVDEEALFIKGSSAFINSSLNGSEKIELLKLSTAAAMISQEKKVKEIHKIYQKRNREIEEGPVSYTKIQETGVRERVLEIKKTLFLKKTRNQNRGALKNEPTL